LIELGNVLVLFFAGLSVNVNTIDMYWWQIIVVGSGYGIFTTGLFGLLGWVSGLCEGIGTVVFFGICCGLSSKQVMTDHLIRSHQIKTMHSKILQGVALFQDGIAILAMAILHSFERVQVDLDRVYASNSTGMNATNTTAMHREGSQSAFGSPPENVWHDRFRLGDEIGRSLALTLAVGLFFVMLNKLCLQRIFHFFTVDGEMLFIGTMAYNLGAAALCSQMGFSPMIGSYFAGLSLSFLPSRHQIEHKISALRSYGMTTFYFMMGIYVQIDASFFESNFAWSIIFTLIVVFVGPVVIWVMGVWLGYSRERLFTRRSSQIPWTRPP